MARTVFCVLGLSVLLSALLIIPKMEISSPGKGVLAERDGVVTSVDANSVTVDDKKYQINAKQGNDQISQDQMLIFPTKEIWQEPAVHLGQAVKRKELLAKGTTKIFFQANVWIFAGLVMILGIVWGVGKAAVYKHIPEYFPEEVGVVGGMVGVLGGLGGFVMPIIFGYLLDETGLWTSSWMMMLILSVACLFWMHRGNPENDARTAPNLMKKIED